MLATVMNGSRQSWEELADGLTETVGASSLREKRRVGRRWWTMRRSDGVRRRRLPRSVSPGRWGRARCRRRCSTRYDRVPRAMGARCAPRERRVPVCVSRSGDVAPVTINGAHHRPPARLRPRPGGIGRSRRGRPAGRGPALAPVRAARSGRRRRRTARHPVPPRFALPGRHGPGAEAGEAARSGPAAAPSPQSEPVRASRPDRESLRSPSPQPELQPLPGEPPGGSLTGTATTPRNAPGRLFGDGGGVESEIDPDAPLEPPGVLEDAGCGGIGGMVVRGGPARSGRQA